MKKKMMNSMTALVMAGICFGVGGAMILGGLKVDKKREEAYQIAVQRAEEQAAARLAAEEVAIPDVYPPLAEMPGEDTEAMEAAEPSEEAAEEISWVSFDAENPGGIENPADAESTEAGAQDAEGAEAEDVVNTEAEDQSAEDAEIEDEETPKAAVDIDDPDTPLAGYTSIGDYETPLSAGPAGTAQKSTGGKKSSAVKKSAVVKEPENPEMIDDYDTPLSAAPAATASSEAAASTGMKASAGQKKNK